MYENAFYKDSEELIAKLNKEIEIYNTLSFREKRVLTLIVDHLSNVKLSKELSISAYRNTQSKCYEKVRYP